MSFGIGDTIMEQKQLDELDESFFNEEFIDDEPLATVVEKAEQKEQKEKKAAVKKTKPAKTTKSSVPPMKEDGYIDLTEEAEDDQFSTHSKPEPIPAEIEIKPAVSKQKKETLKEKKPIETSSPVNPWAEEKKDEEEKSLFGEISTWKVLTGIAVVLLLLAIITQGFKASQPTADVISAPAAASLKTADTKPVLAANNVTIAKNVTKSNTTVSTAKNSLPSPSFGVTAPNTNKQIFLTAKKWHFSPQNIVVERGTKVLLTIIPENVHFVFSLPKLGITKEITETTTVEFTVKDTGSFEYLCSSCEEWRGMTGMLRVE